jgi:hypothetical protein
MKTFKHAGKPLYGGYPYTLFHFLRVLYLLNLISWEVQVDILQEWWTSSHP